MNPTLQKLTARLVSPELERLLDVLEGREKVPVRIKDFLCGFKTLDTGDKLAVIEAITWLTDEPLKKKARTRRALQSRKELVR